MEQPQIPDLMPKLEEWHEDLVLLQQNRLLPESAFISFARDRGLPVRGISTGDPADLHRRGWLPSDGSDPRGNPLFHPFRIYPLGRILHWCGLHVSPTCVLRRESTLKFLEFVLSQMPSEAHFEGVAQFCNRVVDLAILLEPIYWPKIVGHRAFRADMREVDASTRLEKYRQQVLALVRGLSVADWSRVHEHLRIDAAWTDKNAALYVLLRLGNWHERERLCGEVSGALWIRHIAETIRRAFEEAHNVRWPEEDQALGSRASDRRQSAFGSDRRFDDEFRAKPQIAFKFGLFTGSTVRWYVEGETEYGAVLEILPEPTRYGVELVNLHGNIASERNNAAFKLQAGLEDDRALRRFSVISFDQDVVANVRALRRQVQLDNIVGMIAGHDPDFEFANFSVTELVEIAARLDEALGFDGSPIRRADWTEISSARAFEKRYAAVTGTKQSGLKGEKWGRALARYAMEHPRRQTDGRERPLWPQIRAAMHAWNSNYDIQRELFMFDPETLEQIPRPKGPSPTS